MLERGLHYLPGERRSYDLPTRERELEDEVEWLYGEDAKEPPQLANYRMFAYPAHNQQF